MIVGRRILDFYDRRILEILEEDSRTPFSEIARELNVSEGMIRRRVRNLRDSGVIRSFTITMGQ